MKPIIRITESAARYLKGTLATRATEPDQCLRLVAAPGAQVGLVLDEVREGDEIIQIDGAPVLLLKGTMVPLLKGSTLDYLNTPEEPQLTLVK